MTASADAVRSFLTGQPSRSLPRVASRIRPGVGFLDELHQRLDVGRIENALGHATILPYLAGVPAGEDTAARASRTKAGSKIRSAIT